MAQISYGTITITDTTDLEWFYGTDLTHTSGTAVANITGAAVGSMYLNTQTSLAYKCTAIAANGNQTWQYVGNMASGVLEAAQEAIDNIEIGGRNLIYNTLVPNVTSNDTRPNIGGDGTNGYAYGASTGELTTATHGVRHTVTSTSRPGICFGPNNVNIGLHGLETGKMYTWSFDWTAQIFSGSPPTGTSYYLRAILGYVPAGSSSYNTSTYENIYIYRTSDLSDRGAEISGSGKFTFELPAGATAMRLYITTNSTTASYYQAGDFLELRNIKLEVGNKATDWTPAPEDVDLSISEVDSKTNEAASKVEQVSNTLSSTNTTIQQQGTAIQALQKITAPITLDTRDENNPAIVIQAGVSSSEQDNNTIYSRLILSKERISFHKVYDADGDSSTDDDQIDTEVLFIDSTEKQGVIDINNARIQQSIKIGNLEIIAYQGGIAVRRS